MRLRIFRIRIFPLVLVVLAATLLLPNNDAQAAGRGDSHAPHDRRLERKIAKLEQEQNFLLFQRVMYGTDSRYLIINMARKKGTLRYKNRILKDFRFHTSRSLSRNPLQPGALTMTEKIEGNAGRGMLQFGRMLVITGKQANPVSRAMGIPAISVSRKDMESLYYALEQGALVYVVR